MHYRLFHHVFRIDLRTLALSQVITARRLLARYAKLTSKNYSQNAVVFVEYNSNIGDYFIRRKTLILFL